MLPAAKFNVDVNFTNLVRLALIVKFIFIRRLASNSNDSHHHIKDPISKPGQEKMEAKLLIFTFDSFTNVPRSWDYTSIPLSDKLLRTSSSSENIPSLQNAHVVDLLGELDKLFSDIGPLNGW